MTATLTIRLIRLRTTTGSASRVTRTETQTAVRPVRRRLRSPQVRPVMATWCRLVPSTSPRSCLPGSCCMQALAVQMRPLLVMVMATVMAMATATVMLMSIVAVMIHQPNCAVLRLHRTVTPLRCRAGRRAAAEAEVVADAGQLVLAAVVAVAVVHVGVSVGVEARVAGAATVKAAAVMWRVHLSGGVPGIAAGR